MSDHRYLIKAAIAGVLGPLSVAIFLVGIIDVVQWFWGLVT